MYAVFMLSRDYIKHYQIQRNALYAIAICHWVGNFIDESDVERDAPCHSLFYKKKQEISLMNHGFDFVISSTYKLFTINKLYNILVESLSATLWAFLLTVDSSSQYYEEMEDEGHSDVKKPRHAKRYAPWCHDHSCKK